MKKLMIAATLAVGASLFAAPAAFAGPKLTGEERLAKILDGREAGKPVSCITMSQTQNATVIDKTAIVYRVGRTIYVNRPNNADQLDSDDIMVTKTFSSQLCNLDTVQLYSRGGPSMWTGFVGLSDFVPYTRAPTATAN